MKKLPKSHNRVRRTHPIYYFYGTDVICSVPVPNIIQVQVSKGIGLTHMECVTCIKALVYSNNR